MGKFLRKFAIQEDPNRPLPKEAYGWRVYAQALCAAGAAALAGYDHAYIGGTLTLPSFQTAFSITPANKTSRISSITSTLIAGAAFGSILAYILVEKVGRKRSLFCAGIVACVGGVIQMIKGYIELLYTGRVISGIAIGIIIGTIPVYISEIAPPTIRGRLAGLEMVVALLAVLLGYWINYGMEKSLPETSDAQWRIPVGIQFVFPVVLLGVMPWMVESPRWLVRQGRTDEALQNLAWIRNVPQDHEYVQWEFNEIQKAAASSPKGRFKERTAATWHQLLQSGMRRRLVLAVVCKMLHAMNGMTILALYGPLILKSIGFPSATEELFWTGIYGVVKVVVTIVFTGFLIDTWGRRKTILAGCVLIALAQFYLGGFAVVSGSFEKTTGKGAGSSVALLALYVWTAAFAFSWAWFPSVFAAEIFPTHLRALGITITNLVGTIMHFVCAYSIPYMIRNIKSGIFFFFGSITVLSAIIVFIWVPETKSFPLEKTGLIFEGSRWARKARKEAERNLAEEERVERVGSDISTGSVEEKESVVMKGGKYGKAEEAV